MNRWKHNNKKGRKRQVSNEAAVELPDVIADLSIGSSITSPSLQFSSQPYYNMQTKEETTFSYASRYLQAIEQRESSGPSREIIEPVGLTASFGRIETTNEDKHFSHSPRKMENIINDSPSRTNINSTYFQTFTLGVNFNEASDPERPTNNDQNRGDSFGFNYYNDFEVQRFRSMSSEPRSPQRNKSNDKRLRCSSATRVRHNQHKQLRDNDQPISSMLHSYQAILRSPVISPHISPQTSPPMSPPSQRIDYEQTQTSCQGPSNSQTCAYSTLPTNSAVPMYDQLCGTSDSQDSHPSSYGYKIPDLEALLSQASLSRPANLPMVLGCSTRIHNIRQIQDQYNNQSQSPAYLPLGIIVNAVCKTRDWLYVQTAHGAEGYVPYKVCLPLGILPNKTSTCNNTNPAETLAWECHGREDVHNLTMESTPKVQTSYLNGIDISNRSRPRARRRTYNQISESTNQTDSQKLLPAYTRTVDPRRSFRENTQTFTPRLV